MKIVKTLASALTGGLLLCQTALAEPVTIRVVQKDLLTTNREDVAHIQRIEQALARQGMTLRLKLLICHLLVIPTY